MSPKDQAMAVRLLAEWLRVFNALNAEIDNALNAEDAEIDAGNEAQMAKLLAELNELGERTALFVEHEEGAR